MWPILGIFKHRGKEIVGDENNQQMDIKNIKPWSDEGIQSCTPRC